MNKILWKLSNKLSTEDTAAGTFLVLSMTFWWAVTLFIGIAVCTVLSLPLIEHLSAILCTAAYFCLFLGLGGGCLFWKTGKRG